MQYDVAIIGAGVVGAHIARELSRYQTKTVLLERKNDIAMGTTKANSAIVHAGFDAKPGTKKALLNVRGAAMMPEICKLLHIPYNAIGSLVVAFSQEEREMLEALRLRGEKNGVSGLCIVEQAQLREMEPHIHETALAALWAPSAGIVCPFTLCFAAVENAMENGTELLRNFSVDRIDALNGGFTLYAEERQIGARFIVNAAGVHCDDIAKLIGDDSLCTTPRKGEYMLMDKTAGSLARHVLFQCPSEMGKGILVSPTVDGNLLVGPSSQNVQDYESVSTTGETLTAILEAARKTIPAVHPRDVITSFAGLRAHEQHDDFILKPSTVHPHFFHAAGVESPGLSAAPAIGEYLATLIADTAGFVPNTAFSPALAKPTRFRELSDAERQAKITENSAYGKIVCRCETVTEGEILDAIHAKAGARDLDGVKRRVRAGAGRCQGGFCSPKVVELLARELHIMPEEVTKHGGVSHILTERIKPGKGV